jgi:hypothetical protein
LEGSGAGWARRGLVIAVVYYFCNNAQGLAIDGNIRINVTGQAPVLYVHTLFPLSSITFTNSVLFTLRSFQALELIDITTLVSTANRTSSSSLTNSHSKTV